MTDEEFLIIIEADKQALQATMKALRKCTYSEAKAGSSCKHQDTELLEELKKEYCPKCANKGLCESDTPIIKHCLDRRDGSLRNKPKLFKAYEDEAHARAEDFCHKNCPWQNTGKCHNDCKACFMYKIYLLGFIDGERSVK